MTNESFIKVNNKLVLVNGHPITINDIDNGSSGGGAGFKVTFPATATDLNQLSAGSIVQADGTEVGLKFYSDLAGKTIPNVVEICIWGNGYYNLGMTVQTGKIMQTCTDSMGIIVNITGDGESSEVYFGNGSLSRWIPLADTVISSIGLYDTNQ